MDDTISIPATGRPLALVVRDAVRVTLRQTRGNQSEASRRLGISRPRLARYLANDPECQAECKAMCGARRRTPMSPERAAERAKARELQAVVRAYRAKKAAQAAR